jgi:chemotaxis response regulator CheB
MKQISVINKPDRTIGTRLILGEELFPLICINGASFDLSGYETLIRNLPAGSGAAVVVINDLKRAVSPLYQMLARVASMPVEAITDGSCVRPNHVYVLYPGHDLGVLEGEFRLAPVSKPTGWWNAATIFLNSLAQEWPGQIFSVTLSGYGGDGAAALNAVRKAEGITIAQKVRAGGDMDMPLTAISTGHIDWILPVEEIAEMLCGSRQCQSKERFCPRCSRNSIPDQSAAAPERYNIQAA